MIELRLIDVPARLEPEVVRGARVVVIDVLRASTTIVAALDAGAAGVLPVADVDAARRAAAARPGSVLAGERGGLPPAGFDVGNSPLDMTPEAVRGRLVVLTTTNGTAALERSHAAAEVIVACYRNLSAVARALAEPGVESPIVLACGGDEGRPSAEDAACAGALVARLASLAPGRVASDGARATPEPAEVFATAPHARRLVALGLGRDLVPCGETDASARVPRRGADGVLVA